MPETKGDKELAQDIREAVTAVNRAIVAARRAGLRVTISDELAGELHLERPTFADKLTVTRVF
jgi:hypothetical protein